MGTEHKENGVLTYKDMVWRKLGGTVPSNVCVNRTDFSTQCSVFSIEGLRGISRFPFWTKLYLVFRFCSNMSIV